MGPVITDLSAKMLCHCRNRSTRDAVNLKLRHKVAAEGRDFLAPIDAAECALSNGAKIAGDCSMVLMWFLFKTIKRFARAMSLLCP